MRVPGFALACEIRRKVCVSGAAARGLAAVALAVLAVLPVREGALTTSLLAHAAPPGADTAAQPEPHGPVGAEPPEAPQHEAGPVEETHEGGTWDIAARVINFAIMAGVLVYFLRSPSARYLTNRFEGIRRDLVNAETMRRDAGRQLEEIDRQIQALPAEIDALRARGAEEIAGEEARIAQAAAAERERWLEQARREIELQLRVAERELVRHVADLTVRVAADRIQAGITGQDQERLVDRYLARLEHHE